MGKIIFLRIKNAIVSHQPFIVKSLTLETHSLKISVNNSKLTRNWCCHLLILYAFLFSFNTKVFHNNQSLETGMILYSNYETSPLPPP